jgi:hypothetical protein
MKTGLFSVFDSQKSKDRTAGPVFSSLGPVWLQSFCGLETGLPNTKEKRSRFEKLFNIPDNEQLTGSV